MEKYPDKLPGAGELHTLVFMSFQCQFLLTVNDGVLVIFSNPDKLPGELHPVVFGFYVTLVLIYGNSSDISAIHVPSSSICLNSTPQYTVHPKICAAELIHMHKIDFCCPVWVDLAQYGNSLYNLGVST